jgi:hypothetical protein
VIRLDRSKESRPRIRERMRRVLSTPRLILCWVAIWLSAMLTGDYYVRVEAPAMNARISLHQDMVTGNAPYAYRYRVLAPYAAEALARLLQHAPIVNTRALTPPLPYSGLAFTTAYCLLNLAALVTLLWSIGELTWRLSRYDLALLGVAIAAVMVGFTFRDHYYHPWSFWEGAFFALGLLLIHRQQFLLFSALNLFGLINRETSVFLLVAFLLTTLPRDLSKARAIEALHSSPFRFAVGNLIVWVIGFFTLHYVIGYKPSTFTLETAVAGNRAHIWYALVLNTLFIGCVSPLILKGLRLSPPLIRRSALMIPGYLALLLTLGYWWEIRYWITLLPIVVPALVAALANAAPPEELELQLPSVN